MSNDNLEKLKKVAEALVLSENPAKAVVILDEKKLDKVVFYEFENKYNKGELKGDKGDDAIPPTAEELTALIEPLIPEPIPGEPGKDGSTPTKEELKSLIAPLIPEPLKGDPGKDVDQTKIVEEASGHSEEMQAINKQLGDLIPINNAVVRRIPIAQRNGAIGLTDILGLTAAALNPKAAIIEAGNLISKSGKAGALISKVGEKIKPTPATTVIGKRLLPK